MRVRNPLLLLAALALGGCVAVPPPRPVSDVDAVDSVKEELPDSQVERRASLVGTWYGSAPTRDGGRNQWVMVHHPDGTYTASFRITRPSGGVREWREVGLWGVAGDVYFSILKGWLKGDAVEPSDPSDPYNYDAFRILSLDASHMEYESVQSDNRFEVTKVNGPFVFPDGP